MAKSKPLVERTFEELVEEATRDIHSGLLEGGSSGMKAAVFEWLSTVAAWRDLKKEKANG